jgi:UDP-N-acetyl-D-glucosamine dehydrogenase
LHLHQPLLPDLDHWQVRATRFIELAGEINTAMPAYVVGKVAEALNRHSEPIKGSKVGLLGMAFKKSVDDPRESPGFELMELLLERGAVVTSNDPHIPSLPPMRHHQQLRMQSSVLTPE